VDEPSVGGTHLAQFGSVDGTRFGDVRWFSVVGSTNTDLLAAASHGAPEGVVFIADEQTAGRGRRGRQWDAPPGSSLMMSVLLRPPHERVSPDSATLVTSAFAVAALRACRLLTGVAVRLKWPNDLVVEPLAGEEWSDPGYKKVAGILTESVLSGGAIGALVVGMGLNTGWESVPEHLEPISASLNLLSGRPVDRVRLAELVLVEFEKMYQKLLTIDGAAAIAAAANDASATVGRRVRISMSNDVVLVGTAVEVDGRGRLVVNDDAGHSHVLVEGDVVHLRPETSEH